jgi:hypothetical protein
MQDAPILHLRPIEAAAVVRDDHRLASQMMQERLQQRFLLAVVTRPQLRERQPTFVPMDESRQEDAGTG